MDWTVCFVFTFFFSFKGFCRVQHFCAFIMKIYFKSLTYSFFSVHLKAKSKYCDKCHLFCTNLLRTAMPLLKAACAFCLTAVHFCDLTFCGMYVKVTLSCLFFVDFDIFNRRHALISLIMVLTCFRLDQRMWISFCNTVYSPNNACFSNLSHPSITFLFFNPLPYNASEGSDYYDQQEQSLSRFYQ